MGWLTGWAIRKLITVNGTTYGSLSDYQMKLTVNQGSGTDSPGIVYCGGNILNSYADLRFTKSDDGSTLLYYWIESITGTSPNLTATVWIKLAPSPDTIPYPGTYSFYIYYNNPSATDSSNGIVTFIDFDDFSTDTTANYQFAENSSGTGTISVTSGKLNISGPGEKLVVHKSQSPPSSYIIEAYMSEDSIANLGVDGFVNSLSNATQGYTYYIGNIGGLNFILSRFDRGITPFVPISFTTGVYYYFKGSFAPSNLSGIWNRTTNGTSSTDNTRTSGYYGIYANGTGHVDWWFVRKYASPEPTFGTPGNPQYVTFDGLLMSGD